MARSGNPKTYIAAGTIPAYRLVKMDTDGKVVLCTLAANPIGWVDQSVVAGDAVAVHNFNSPYTAQLTAAKALATPGLALYAAANGKVTDTAASGGNAIFMNNAAASGDGSVIECTRIGPGATSV